MKTGIELITEERLEQIEKHGFDLKHDKNEHDGNELSWNASILASPIALYCKNDYANSNSFSKPRLSDDWNLPLLNFSGNVIRDNEKLPKDKRIKQLIVAGALIAAEIDRLQNDN